MAGRRLPLSYGTSASERQRAARFQRTSNRLAERGLAVFIGVLAVMVAASGVLIGPPVLLVSAALLLASVVLLWRHAGVRPAPYVGLGEHAAPFRQSLRAFLLALGLFAAGMVVASIAV